MESSPILLFKNFQLKRPLLIQILGEIGNSCHKGAHIYLHTYLLPTTLNHFSRDRKKITSSKDPFMFKYLKVLWRKTLTPH